MGFIGKKERYEAMLPSIGKRFNRQMLENLIKDVFKDKPFIEEVKESELLENEDYRFDCYCGSYDFSIWFAKTRQKDQFIITEFAID